VMFFPGSGSIFPLTVPVKVSSPYPCGGTAVKGVDRRCLSMER